MEQFKLDDYHEQWLLSDMKRKILHTMNCLLNDQDFTKNEAVYHLIEVINMIEIKEKLEKLKYLEKDDEKKN